MKYHFKIYNEDNGYWAECIELNGCQTQADTIEELEINMQEVLNLYLDEPEDTKIDIPLPKRITKSKNIKEVPVEPAIAFAIELKYFRKKHNYTQKQVAELLGMKNLYSYQRLEKKGDPKLSTIYKVKQVFPEFSFNDILV